MATLIDDSRHLEMQEGQPLSLEGAPFVPVVMEGDNNNHAAVPSSSIKQEQQGAEADYMDIVVTAPSGAGLVRQLQPPEPAPGMAPFMALDVTFVVGRVLVTRPIPAAYQRLYLRGLGTVKEVLMRLCHIQGFHVGTVNPEVVLMDKVDVPSKAARDTAPIEDLRLADQMVCLSLVSEVADFSFWYFQFFATDDVGRLLGVTEDGQWADLSVLRHIESMTSSRVHILARDPDSWRSCFMLLGEKVLVEEALSLLIGAVQSGKKPDMESYGWIKEHDSRLEEIKKELREQHGLEAIETQRDGNCLFRALSWEACGDVSHHLQVREALVSHLADMTDILSLAALIDKVSPEDYLSMMRRNTVWGGHTEIVAFADLFKRTVTVFFDNTALGLRSNEIGPQTGTAQGDPCRLLNYQGHYWLLRPVR